MAQHKLDIFKTLKNINSKNANYWDELTDEEKKGFYPIVIIQWMSGTKDPAQIYFLNCFVNQYIFQFYKHPELLYHLMCVCSAGTKERPVWRKKKKSSKFPKSVLVIQRYFGYNKRHAEDALKCLSGNDIMEFAEELGYQKEELKLLKKECNGIL
jgi:hypothetical protein